MNTEEKYKEIDRLIERYLSDNSDKETILRLKAWCMQSESDRNYIRERLELWFSSGVAGDVSCFDKEKGFELLKKRIAKVKSERIIIRHFPWKAAYRVAAVVLILLLPLVAYWRGRETVKQTFADIVIESPMGARTKLYLPDGTLVWLNAGSKIVYSQGFGMDERRLDLEGEGYFEVTRNEQIPFEINTKEVDLKVLGTKFNFKNYPDDEEVTVNLMEGKVSLHNELKDMPELYLEPNEKMTMNKVTGEMKKLKTKVMHAKSWTVNELFFDEELLTDIAKKLMRSYNVEIKVADSLKTRRFYGSFDKSKNTIDDVLKAISSTGRLKYSCKDNRYILY